MKKQGSGLNRKVKRHGRMRHNENGFTLLEVITALIVASIMGAMLVQVMGTNVTGSAESCAMVDQAFDISGEMEKITADYRDKIKRDTLDLDEFNAGLSNYEYVDDENTGFISFSDPEGYGVCSEISCSGNCDILKVTLKKGHQSIAALFSE